MPRSINFDDIDITEVRLRPLGDGTWAGALSYVWKATAASRIEPQLDFGFNLTAAQQTAILNFIAQKKADLKTKDGI